jgi:hypothetical protein
MHEGIMSALRHDTPILQNQDPICVDNRGKPMRHNDDRDLAVQIPKRLLDRLL